MTADDGLRDLIRHHLVGWHWTVIETGAVAAGVPDLNGCRDGIEVWVECKATRYWAVAVRPPQVAWIDRRTRAGGRVWVAVRRRRPPGLTRSGAGYDELWLVPGIEWPRLVDGRLLAIDPAACRLGVGGPLRWPWTEVERALVGGLGPNSTEA